MGAELCHPEAALGLVGRSKQQASRDERDEVLAVLNKAPDAQSAED